MSIWSRPLDPDDSDGWVRDDGEPERKSLVDYRPAWQRVKDATRAKRYKLDVPLEHVEGCLFCAALNLALDDGSGVVGRDSADAQRLGIVVDLDALAERYGECSCLDTP